MSKLNKLDLIMEGIQGIDAGMIDELKVMLESQIQEEIEIRDQARELVVETLKEDHAKEIEEIVKTTQTMAEQVVDEVVKKEISKNMSLLESKMVNTIEYNEINEAFKAIVATMNKVYPQKFLEESATNEMKSEIQTLKDIHESLIAEHDAVKAEKFNIEKELSFINITESLSDINKQKVTKFLSEIEFSNISEYNKAATIYTKQLGESFIDPNLDLSSKVSERKFEQTKPIGSYTNL